MNITAPTATMNSCGRRLCMRPEVYDHENQSSRNWASRSVSRYRYGRARCCCEKTVCGSGPENDAEADGQQPRPRINLTAEGPDATLYMYHLPGITFDICRSLAEGVREKRHTMGFTQLVCTGGVGDIRFTSDISAQPALPAKANSTVIAEAALPVKTNPAVPQQAQSSQVIKLPLPVQGQKARKKPAEQPVSQYMRGAAIIYLEALQARR